MPTMARMKATAEKPTKPGTSSAKAVNPAIVRTSGTKGTPAASRNADNSKHTTSSRHESNNNDASNNSDAKSSGDARNSTDASNS